MKSFHGPFINHQPTPRCCRPNVEHVKAEDAIPPTTPEQKNALNKRLRIECLQLFNGRVTGHFIVRETWCFVSNSKKVLLDENKCRRIERNYLDFIPYCNQIQCSQMEVDSLDPFNKDLRIWKRERNVFFRFPSKNSRSSIFLYCSASRKVKENIIN